MSWRVSCLHQYSVSSMEGKFRVEVRQGLGDLRRVIESYCVVGEARGGVQATMAGVDGSW